MTLANPGLWELNPSPSAKPVVDYFLEAENPQQLQGDSLASARSNLRASQRGGSSCGEVVAVAAIFGRRPSGAGSNRLLW